MNIKDILINSHGYTEQEAEMMAKGLSELDVAVMPVFEAWRATGSENSDMLFHGYSIDSLRADYDMNFFAALMTLDWIAKDPENALPAIKRGIM